MMHSHQQGCYCVRCDRAAEQRAEAIDALVTDYRNDADQLREAELWTAGTFDETHYSELTLALHALARLEPADLIGSDALARVLRLARVEHDAIEDQLRLLAEHVLDTRREAA